MNQFLSPSLSILEKIYRFVGGQVRATFLDLDIPIQLVHDTSREAELGSAKSAYEGWLTTNDLAVTLTGAGGAQTGEDNLTPITTTTLPDVDISQWWGWLMDASLILTDGFSTLTQASLIIEIPSRPNVYSAMWIPILLWASRTSIQIDIAGDYQAALLHATSPHPNLPFMFPFDATFTLRVDGDPGAANESAIAQLRYWVAPRGVYPPGLR